MKSHYEYPAPTLFYTVPLVLYFISRKNWKTSVGLSVIVGGK